MPVSAVKLTAVCLWLFALLKFGWTQDVWNDSQVNDADVSNIGTSFMTKTGYTRHRRASANEATFSCLAPPQPFNGKYKLDQNVCDDTTNCEISEGTEVKPGSQLIYHCNSGYRAEGNTEVYCRSQGKWSAIPNCTEIKCESLNSVSTTVSCTRFGKEVDCNFPVLPDTRAEVTCRHGYKKETDFAPTRRGVVNCNVNGKWDPQPIRCVAVCGVATLKQQPLILGGTPTKVSDFPWHASLFQQIKSSSGIEKLFLCGATIIQTNLLLTAAHCIYNEGTRTIRDPKNLFVITGNIFRDYDSLGHDPNVVRKATVKNVYPSCNFYGLIGNYASDIGLLELQHPFEFSSILLPACLDDSEYRDQFLEPGVYGRVAGFGRTATGTTSGVLQTLTVPYISYSQCRASNNGAQNEAFISSDKFCAGYNNGSAVCEGDSGGGLVFKKGDLWYVMGIVSVGLGVDIDNGEKKCNKYSYSLYTKVSIYINWIQDVLLYVGRKQRYPSCSHHSLTSAATSATPATMSGPTSTTSSQSVNDERGLIARQKCMEYSQYEDASTCQPFMTDNDQLMNVSVSTGKTKAGRMEFPHMAAIGYVVTLDQIRWNCGGTLISENFVMTSSICTYTRAFGDAAWVRLGDLNLVRSDDGATPVDRRITERIRHPDYKPPTEYHDIALLRLESPVSFNGWIRPACLHTTPTVGIQEAIATGWGRVEQDDDKESDDLMKVTLPLINHQICSAKWTSGPKWRGLPNGIVENWLICAGGPGRNTCRRDTGGPLVIHRSDSMRQRCTYDVIGLMSLGRECGSGFPGLYTRIYHYIPWIESVVWRRG